MTGWVIIPAGIQALSVCYRLCACCSVTIYTPSLLPSQSELCRLPLLLDHVMRQDTFMTSTGLDGFPSEFKPIVEFQACLSIIGLKLIRASSSFFFQHTSTFTSSHLVFWFPYSKLPFTLPARSKMGIMELRNLHLYPLCRYSSKPGGPHLQGQVCQSGPVDAGAGPGQRSLYRFKHQDGTICYMLICHTVHDDCFNHRNGLNLL